MLPQVTGEFRCGADPTLRFAPSGVAVGSVRAIATSRKKDETTGEWSDDKTCWVGLLAFKQVAENMAESFRKGDWVVVTGKLQVEDWTDNDGNKRTSVTVLVDSIGPSVRWAAARPISSSTRQTAESGGGSGSGGDDDPWATTPTAGTEDPPF